MATSTVERPSAAELRAQKEEREAQERAALEEARARAEADAAAAESAGDTPIGGVEDDGQTFMFEQGRRVTLGTLVERDVPVEYEIRLTGKAVKGIGEMGLVGFESPEILLVVPARAGKVEVAPTYDGDGSIEKVTVRAFLKPQMVYDAATEAGQAALRGQG